MATTAITDETPIRMPSTVRNERSLFARASGRQKAMPLTASGRRARSLTLALWRSSRLDLVPSRMWMVRWACAATSRSWVTRMIVLPSSCRPLEQPHDLLAGGASRGCRWARRPAGSTGCITSARAMATRWRWPPDSSFGPVAACASPGRPSRSASLAPAPAARPSRHARVDERQLHVVQRACARGSRLKVWKTKPISRLRIARQLVVVHLARPRLPLQHVAAACWACRGSR